MSITTVKANHCDVCGYEWLKTAKTPKRCANPGCRERNWNRPTVAAKVNRSWVAAGAYETEPSDVPASKYERAAQALPRDQQTRSYGIQHTPTCKCLVCRPEGK